MSDRFADRRFVCVKNQHKYENGDGNAYILKKKEEKKRLWEDLLTNEGRLAQVAPPLQRHLQELDLLVHHVQLLLQGDPGPVQTKLLVLQPVASCRTKNTKSSHNAFENFPFFKKCYFEMIPPLVAV